MSSPFARVVAPAAGSLGCGCRRLGCGRGRVVVVLQALSSRMAVTALSHGCESHLHVPSRGDRSRVGARQSCPFNASAADFSSRRFRIGEIVEGLWKRAVRCRVRESTRPSGLPPSTGPTSPTCTATSSACAPVTGPGRGSHPGRVARARRGAAARPPERADVRWLITVARSRFIDAARREQRHRVEVGAHPSGAASRSTSQQAAMCSISSTSSNRCTAPCWCFATWTTCPCRTSPP